MVHGIDMLIVRNHRKVLKGQWFRKYESTATEVDTWLLAQKRMREDDMKWTLALQPVKFVKGRQNRARMPKDN